jgi:IclR family pca regulon transcriptional regulator
MSRLRPADAEKRRHRGDRTDFLEALARGISVMTAFDGKRPKMILSDVARATDLPKATVRRAMHTLLSLGFIERNGRLFRMTPKVLTLATAYLSSNCLSTIVQPLCEPDFFRRAPCGAAGYSAGLPRCPAVRRC